MPNLTPLQQLTETIYTAFPELKELGVGCEIDYKGKKAIIIHHTEKNWITVKREQKCYSEELHTSSIDKIIGKKITLTDVLRWLGTLKENEHIDYEVVFDELHISYACSDTASWDLNHNLLDNQSQELITFLNNL